MKTSEQEWGRGASSSRGKYHTPNTGTFSKRGDWWGKKTLQKFTDSRCSGNKLAWDFRTCCSWEMTECERRKHIFTFKLGRFTFQIQKYNSKGYICNVISTSHQQVLSCTLTETNQLPARPPCYNHRCESNYAWNYDLGYWISKLGNSHLRRVLVHSQCKLGLWWSKWFQSQRGGGH